VLALVAAGRTNRQIGEALFITEKTALLHVSHILTKLGVAGRDEAAAIAHRLGLDKDDPRRPWPFFLGEVGDIKVAAPTSAPEALATRCSPWPRRRQHVK
jgi:Bacterial regulatory proteins, luxR family